jgi:5-methylcytosine-specific restriction enzyme subunit McrC
MPAVHEAGATGRQGTILLQEHSSRRVVLSDVEADVLRREYGRAVQVHPTPQPGEYELRTTSHAGFIVLPGHRVLEIRPKLPIQVLLALMARAGDLGVFRPDLHACSTLPELLELLAAQFIALAEGLATRGIRKAFLVENDDLSAPRGKIHLAETLRRSPVLRLHHHCVFPVFSPDGIENRILKLACQRILPFPFKQHRDLPQRCRRLLGLLSEVQDDAHAEEGFRTLACHRLNEHYRPALSLARLILTHLSASGSRGGEPFVAFLVDMNQLFERYVSHVLRDGLRRHAGIDVALQEGSHLDMAAQVEIRPDIVVRKNGTPVLVVDAKYKRVPGNADLYQVIAYCEVYHLLRAVLVVPAHEVTATRSFLVRPAGHLHIVLMPVDISGTMHELEQVEKRCVEAVLGQLYAS